MVSKYQVMYNDPMSPSIVLVEDNPHDVEFALFALAKCGLQNPVLVLGDGEDALDYFFHQNGYASRPPDNPALILLDIKMPKVDGMEVLKAIRATPSLARTPVIMLTHSELDSDMHRARLLGVDQYIVKPIELDQFVADVCRALTTLIQKQ